MRSLAWDGELGRVLIGTLSCEVYEINTEDGENLQRFSANGNDVKGV